MINIIGTLLFTGFNYMVFHWMMWLADFPALDVVNFGLGCGLTIINGFVLDYVYKSCPYCGR